MKNRIRETHPLLNPKRQKGEGRKFIETIREFTPLNISVGGRMIQISRMHLLHLLIWKLQPSHAC
ncbi:unnamed protein product, partial [Musa acuminata subsp. malaccensis]